VEPKGIAALLAGLAGVAGVAAGLVVGSVGCGAAVRGASVPGPSKGPSPALRYQDLALPAHGARPVSPDGPGAAPPATLDARDVDADLALLGYALDRAYAGRHVHPEAAFGAMSRALEASRRAPRTAPALCDAIGDALWELPDAHLVAREPLASGSRRRCGARAKAAQRKPLVGAPYGADETKPPFVADLVAVGRANLGVLALHRLPPASDPAWADYDWALRDLVTADGIVIDLRGNGGGDDSRGMQLARTLTDSQPDPGFVRTHQRRSPEALTLLLNGFELEVRQPDGSLPAWAAERRAAEVKERDDAARSPLADRTIDAPRPGPPGPKAYPGEVAVLVDASCASSCESTLRALRRHPRAVVIGERTAGYVGFGQVGTLVLPHSGVEIGIPTKHFEQEGGKSVDKVGFEPDVVVPPGGDAFDVASSRMLAGLAAARVVPVAEYVVEEATRAKETERLASLGLTVPPGGVVLERPFAAPYTRRSFVVPGGWLGRRSARVVYAPALRADLDALEAVMTRAYGGHERARKRGFDWGVWFTGWRAKLGEAGARFVQVKAAFEPVRALQALQLDNHTTIPLGVRFGSGSRVDRLSGEPRGACDAVRDRAGRESPLDPKDRGHAPRATERFDGEELTRAWWIARPAALGELVAIRCGGAWSPLTAVAAPRGEEVAARVTELAGQEKDRPIAKHIGDAVAVIRLPTFSKPNGEIVARERASWETRSGNEKAIVVDLRGNDGGDAAWAALEGWLSKDDLAALSGFERRIGASCLYPALRWGYASSSSSSLRPPLTDAMRSSLGWSLAELGKPDDAACPARFQPEHAARHYADRRPPPRKDRPRVVVLVDGGCGSDCEQMVVALRRLPETVVVGQNTFGVIEYIQPGYSVLPNTRLAFRVALGTSDVYGDDRSVDGRGLDVDVLLEGPEAWSKTSVMRLVEKLSAR